MVMQHLDMGQDIANYLETMNTFFGQDVAGMGLLRPPLIALPLKLFTLAFGTLTGVKALGVLASVAIGIPFYLLARRISHPWIAVAISIGFVFSPIYSNILSWGYLNIIGIFFILLTLHFLLLLLDKPSWRDAILTGLFVSLVVGFHQLCFALLIVLLTFFLIALALFNREMLFRNYKLLAISLAVASILSIPYIATYLHLLELHTIEETSVSTSNIPLTETNQYFTLSNPYTTYPPGLGFWIIIFILTAIGLVLLWRQDRNRTLLLTITALLPLLTLIFLLASGLSSPFDELFRRSFSLTHVSLWLLVGVTLSWLLQNFHPAKLPQWCPRTASIILIASLIPMEIISSQFYLQSRLDHYDYLDDTHLQVMDWIAQETEAGEIIIAYPHALGWWIKGEAKRNTFTLNDRNREQYMFAQEQSMVADRVLSRNQGLENGNLRLAMTYPYGNTPGNPVLGVYIGGLYQDVLMFNDEQNYIEIEGEDSTTLAEAQSKEINITGDSGSMQAATSYQMDGVEIIRTITLNRGEQAVTISYEIKGNNTKATRLDMPVLLCQQPKSVSIDADNHSFEVTQGLETLFDGIVSTTTQVTVNAEGAILKEMTHPDQQVRLSFDIENKEATINLHFIVTTPQLGRDTPVFHYEVPQLIKDYEIDYVAVDLRPHASLWNDIPLGTEEWLNNCPYYKLVYSKGDIRIYQVDTSVLS